ncbi:hypothetical protein INT44_005105 [Umbelopsis vinacea]|uniref:HMG box domain-containing protein n=1 Tax=Umbelopsis vinacea TaxID=44442 RepID=A0A8H7UMQ3_9FUNG|nr:hypothetical protein INT44_005105 [Umbelopsis vinacea]
MDGFRREPNEDSTNSQPKTVVKLTRHGHEIPRPKNCFLSYRTEVASKLVQNGIDSNSRSISKLVANLWKNESEDVKQHFRYIAEQEKLKHQEQYPNYKFNPRKRRSSDVRPLSASSTKNFGPDNPPRKMARRNLPPVSDRVEPGIVTRTKRKYRRSAGRKPAQNQTSTRRKRTSNISVEKCTALEPFSKYTTEPLFEKYIMATLRGDEILPMAEVAEPQNPGGSWTQTEEQAISSDVLNDRPGCTDELDCDPLDLKSPVIKVESEHFLEQAALSVDSNLFVKHEETANDCAWVEKPSSNSLPGLNIESIPYPPHDTDFEVESSFSFDPMHDTMSKELEVSLIDCLMDEASNTLDPSSLTPSLLTASHRSEASDESIDKEFDNLSAMPFIQELVKILHDEQGIQDYLKKLTSLEEHSLVPEVSTRVCELALCLPPAWSSDWYETDKGHNHIHNAIPSCDIKIEHDSTISLDEFIDVDGN